MKKMKKMKKILFGALGLLAIPFALTGCSNTTPTETALEEGSNRTSLVAGSNAVSQTKLSATSASYSYTLNEAVENNMEFNRIWFDTQFYYASDEGDYWDFCVEYENVAYGVGCTFFDYDSHQYQNLGNPIDAAFIPVYSSELGRFLYGVEFIYNMDGEEAYEKDTNPLLEYVNIYFFDDVTLTTYTDVVNYVDNNLRPSVLEPDVHMETLYDEHEDYYISKDITNKNTVLQLEKEISLNLEANKIIFFGLDKSNAILIQSLDDFSEAVMAGMMASSGEVTDADSPLLNIPTVRVDVDNIISFNDIKSKITATDPTEGDITHKIQIVDNEYVLDENGKIAIGNYLFTVSVSDDAGNTDTQQGLIVVEDKKVPQITATNISTLYNDQLTDEEIKALFTYSDNYDSNDDLEVVIDASNYTNNANTTGEYDIVITVTDSSDNVNTATSKVTVYDNIKPVLIFPKNLTFSTISPISLEDVKSLCSASDDYDGKLEFTLTDNNGLEGKKEVGEYNLTISATDSHNNTATETFKAMVIDKDIPSLEFDMNFFIYVSKSDLLTEANILSLLIETGAVEGTVEENNVESVKTDYFLSPHEVGKYDLKVKLSDGTTYENTIVVTENEEEEEFKFSDLFTGEYWNKWVENWKDSDNWNWLHWTIISIGAVAVLSAVVAVLKIKKK